MKSTRSVSAPVFAALVSVLASAPSTARPADERLPFAAEVESCVATVNAHLDLETAKRVRHLVSDARHTGLGYALTIETSVFFRSDTGATEQRFDVYCIARGTNKPSTFRIEEIAT